MTSIDGAKRTFSTGEIGAFKAHAVFVAAIAVGLFVVAPKGGGRVVGILFAVLLLPTPPLVIWAWRRMHPTLPLRAALAGSEPRRP